jgi:hypothetical protein
VSAKNGKEYLQKKIKRVCGEYIHQTDERKRGITTANEAEHDIS